MAGARRVLQTRYVKRDQVVNAGTAQAAPLVVAWNLGHVTLDAVRIRVPSGPSGLAGINIAYAGVLILPSEQPGEFLIGDDEVWEMDVGLEISLPLTLTLYNTDIYPHTFYLRAAVQDMVLVTAGAVTAGQVIVSSLPSLPGPSDADLDAAIAIPPAGEQIPPGPASVGDMGVSG